MCRNIFGTGKAVVLEIGYCVTKGIIHLREKVVYSGDMTKKRRYCPKGVHGDFIYNGYEDNDANNVGIIETITQENKSF